MSELKELGVLLDRLWSNSISSLNVDLAEHSISLQLSAHQEDKVMKHDIRFYGVSAFYFVADSGKERFNISDWENVELSEIHYYPKAIDKITHHYQGSKAMKSYFSLANFVLEIWSSALFIEARGVTIDGSHFEVGYPD